VVQLLDVRQTPPRLLILTNGLLLFRCNRWLLLRFDVLGGLSTFVTTGFALLHLDAGLAGFISLLDV